MGFQNGDTEVANAGNLTATEIKRICKFIKENKQDLFEVWHKTFGDLEFFGEPGKKFDIDCEGDITPLIVSSVYADMPKKKQQ